MTIVARNPVLGVCDQQYAQLQRQARILEFCVFQGKSLYFQKCENKGADQTADAQSDLRLCCSLATKSGFLAMRRSKSMPYNFNYMFHDGQIS